MTSPDGSDDWLGDYRPFDAFDRFAEAQRLGLDAATSLMARWAEMFTDGAEVRAAAMDLFGAVADASTPLGADASVPSEASADEGAPDLGAIRREASRSMETVLEMARRLFESSLDLADSAMRRPQFAAWMSDAPTPEQLRVDAVAGDLTTATVWLHPVGGVVPKVTMSVTPLRDAAGNEPAAALTFDPPTLVDVASGESRSVALHVDADSDCASGTYFGMILADGLDGLALPVRLTVGGAP
jgi:hypothetical protein